MAIAETGRTMFGCKCTDSITNATVIRDVEWKLFYPQCGKMNQQCNPQNGAYLAAITVCEQNLWTWADQLN